MDQIQKNKSMEETIMAKEIGYRTETFFGEGYRNAASVMAHKTFVLDNTDILSYRICYRL